MYLLEVDSTDRDTVTHRNTVGKEPAWVQTYNETGLSIPSFPDKCNSTRVTSRRERSRERSKAAVLSHQLPAYDVESLPWYVLA